MTTYVTENTICDCCGGVVLGHTYVRRSYSPPMPTPDTTHLHVTGDICDDCRPVLQETFNNVSELQRMKRGAQEPELPEAMALRLKDENDALKKQIDALTAAPYANKPYGAPDQQTAQEMMYRMKIAEMERKKLQAMYPMEEEKNPNETYPYVSYGTPIKVS